MKKDCYKNLGFKRLNVFSMVPALFGKKTRETISETKKNKVDGNFAGDGWQNGGALVVNMDGKALLSFKQETPGEHVDPNDVLRALRIEGHVDVHASTDTPSCDEGACALPKKKEVKNTKE
ncbi:unnamed protein product [Candidula unifasciata]|uniref:Uncharacterized protein n=1 Tax=Candidula unifasciata TaxID=100452 RepID=A0A8S4A0V4_9EUPU|nr:unnamed protein product [Candidula unifasciata]